MKDNEVTIYGRRDYPYCMDGDREICTAAAAMVESYDTVSFV
jgi:hypothetical protein